MSNYDDKQYQYVIELQSAYRTNLLFYNTFRLRSVQAIVQDENYFDVSGNVPTNYTTQIYQLNVTGNTSNQPLDIIYNQQLVGIMAQIFGPSNTISSRSTPSTWYPNPVVTYPANFIDRGVSLIPLCPGPSFGQSIRGTSGNLSNPWEFYIQVASPPSETAEQQYQSFPIYSVFGSCSNTTCTKDVSTFLTDLTRWQKFSLLDLPEGATVPPCDKPNGPIGKYMGFPFSVDSVFNMGYVNVVFTLPYSGNYISEQVFSGDQNNTGGTSSTSLPGYLLMFYQRVTPPTCGGEDLVFTLPETAYPVIYDPLNLQTNVEGTYTTTQSLLGFLNNALGTSYTSVNDLFLGQNWLENVLLSSANGGATSCGVDFGDPYGSGWFIGGYVPYNFTQQFVSDNTTWAPSQESLSYATTGYTAGPVFCSGSLVLGTVTNPANTGNLFWSVL